MTPSPEAWATAWDYRYLVGTLVNICSHGFSSLDYGELFTAGLEGAASAADSFDPDRGATLKTWVHTRIRGAVLDEIRRQARWSGRLRTNATSRQAFVVHYLEELLPGHEDLRLADTVNGVEAPGEPFELVIQSLGERERDILHLYFVEDLTLQAIAERFGVTESRVSQIKTAALTKLRDQIEEVA
jgi:RNA polymerase sigma factor for flagellar operon FliA